MFIVGLVDFRAFMVNDLLIRVKSDEPGKIKLLLYASRTSIDQIYST